MNSNPKSGSASSQIAPSFLDASSIGYSALSRLKVCGGEGVIHGVFDGAVNILLTNGLISLVPEAGERGPLNIMVRLPAGQQKMSSLGIAPGDMASVKGSTVEVGGRWLVSFGSAEIYSPTRKLALPVLEEGGIAANLEVARRTALLLGNMAGLGGLLALVQPRDANAKASKLNLFASAALPRVIRLEQAFRSEEKGELGDAVRELIGLGPGLTPSSDDMLAGLVLLCALYAKNQGCRQRATQLVARATAAQSRGRTTILSEEFLGQAASGRGNERVMSLCTAMLTGGRESVERETKRVLAIGETSGTDTTLGILLGAMLCTGRRFGLAAESA